MAKMIPAFTNIEDLESYLPSNDYGQGRWWERKLYDLMRDEFPDGWTVFHHQYTHDSEYRHEYDFLVVVPGKGIVNLDAKGYGWGYQGGMWFRERRQIRDYDDPILQAEQAIKTLNNVIRSKISGDQPWGGYGYCLAFAGAITCPAMEAVFVQDGARSIDANPRAWAQNLIDVINGVLDCPNAQKQRKYFTKQIEESIVRFFDVPYGQNPARDEDFRTWDYSANIALTYKQRAVVARLRQVEVLHVIGAAGTGKTVVATQLLEESHKDKRKALYVCYNRALAETIMAGNPKLKGDVNIVLSNFDRLPFARLPVGRDLRQIVGVNAPENDWSAYRRAIRNALDRFSMDNRGIFDLIVIDEAQDLSVDDIVSLYNLLARDGKIVVFSDRGQTIFNGDWSFGKDSFGEVEYAEMMLNENWRNSSIIHDHYKDYAEVESPIAVLTDCQVPVQEFTDDVKALIEKLVNENRRDPRDIVILSCRIDELNGLEGSIPGTQCCVRRVDPEKITQYRNKPNTVIAATVQSFKGLESPIVILMMGCQGNTSDDDWDRLRYVGESRAKYELYLKQVL